MTARIIDGKALADELFGKVTAATARLAADHGLEPGLAVVLVGSNPASEIYVRSKSVKTVAAGMRSALSATGACRQHRATANSMP